MPSSTIPTYPLRKIVALVFNGDAYHIYLEPHGNGVVLDKVVRFRNNQNVVGEDQDFFQLDRPTRRAIIRAVNKEFKKTVYPKPNG